MEMAELNGSMQLAGKRKSPPETTLGGSASEAPNKQYRPWLQQVSPASNGILHIPTNMLSQKTLHSLMHGKKVTQTESPLQKSVKPVVSKKQQIPPQRSVKAMDEVNESVRSKMRESLASALALVQKDDESPKGKENIGTAETPVITQENTQSFQPVSPASISVPIGEGTMSEMPTAVESSVQKDSEIPVDIRMEDVNQSDGLKSQYDEVFPRDNVPFTDIIFPNDDLLHGNELSWVLEHVSDLGETKDYGTGGEKSFQDPKLLASKIEMELYKLFGGVNKKYRERGRSLLFNLKDKNNPELRERVLSEEISAERLCSMTAEELASKELSQWRQAKAEEMAKMVVLQDTDIDVRRLVRKTHKGEFQVEIEPVDRGTVDVSGGIMSRSKRRPKAKSHSVKTTLKDEAAKADSENSRSTPPSTEEIDPMQGLGIDDELKDVEFLPPIVSLDEFMESLDSEPPFESPHGNSEMQVSPSEKSDSEAGSDSKSPKGSPKKPSDKSLPEPKPEKIDEVSPKLDDNVKVDDDVARLEKTSALSDDKGERAWDGILQLSMSSVVPVTGIFKSGEKAETSEWPAMVEVKGRVRLSGFGKFIQELPKSRTRALMVMYLACKDGISESQRGSLIEVIDSYVADQRVGYAEPASGVELYLCPTRGETLDLLSKVISQEQLDEVKSLDIGLVGVVVWRRAVVPKPGSGSRRQHSSSSFLGSKTSVLPVNKKQRMHVSEKPLVVASMRNHHHGYVKHDAVADDDDVPPGFGPVASRDDDDLPEFNFNSSVVPVSSPQPLPAQSKSLDQVRKLIHKYGKSASINDDDDDDDIPEWQPQPHVPSHQLPPPPPPPPAGFRPEIFRPPQDGWWDNQNGGSGQHYERNQSRNRGF
ncbi:Transcription elongation factor S-II central domain [Arabidopsis suecica]|uniref:Transcription elongation factor S-II central domain n=1 Tax=Arabidopsis suecica TaxID=45249 RepID=A0A8T1Z9Y9_ARASU|nr:Transcription elongation factor S-II central domain [Arabidopsis suecica]